MHLHAQKIINTQFLQKKLPKYATKKNPNPKLTELWNRLLAHLAINRRHSQKYAISLTSRL